MADHYRVARAGLNVELLFPFGIPRIPQPGSRMYQNLAEALSGYWVDSSQVLYRPPRPRLSDAYLELMLPEEGVLIQFSYDELRITVNQTIGSHPEDIGAILESLCDVTSREMPNQELGGPVFIRYWAHASILAGATSKLLDRFGSTEWAPGLQLLKATFGLQHSEAARPDFSIEVGSSEEAPNGFFLDYNAVIDKKSSSSLVSVVSEAFKARGDLLEKLNLHPDGNEEFASWFTTGSVKDGQKL